MLYMSLSRRIVIVNIHNMQLQEKKELFPKLPLRAEQSGVVIPVIEPEYSAGEIVGMPAMTKKSTVITRGKCAKMRVL